MPSGDELSGMERRTTGQLRPLATHKRKLYKDHDSPHREEYHEAMSPYQRHYTTTREDRKSHRPNRKIATGSPLPWQDPAQHTASPSRKNTRAPSGLRHDDYLGRDPGAFQSNGKSQDERRHRSNRSRAPSAPRQRSPARSHRSSGSRGSHSSYHDGLTPMGIDTGVDHDRGWSSYWPSTPKTQYYPDPPTPGKGYPEENDRYDEDMMRLGHHSPATSYYDGPPPRY